MKSRINKWVIDNYLIDSSYQSDLNKSLEEAGFEIFQADYLPFVNEKLPLPENFIDEPVGIYGSFEFVREYTKKYSNIMAFSNSSNFKCSSYLSYMDKDCFLNGDGVFLPYGMLVKSFDAMFDYFKTDKVFIRPDTGFKAFTGLPLTKENKEVELNALERLTNPSADMLVLISKAKEIKKEIRLIVANKKIITGSSYIINGEFNINEELPENAIKYAEAFLEKSEWAPDSCFICDVAELENGDYKIVELNAFSHSDFYNADFSKGFIAAGETLYNEQFGE